MRPAALRHMILASLVLVAGSTLDTMAGSPVRDDGELFSPYLFARRAPAGEPSVPPADPPTTNQAPAFAETVRGGILLVRQGRYLEAVDLLEPHVDGDHFPLLHALGVAYVRLDRNQEAYDTLLRAHQLRPEVAAPLLPAALACAKMARRCYEYRSLALEYLERGGRFKRFAEKIANHIPWALRKS